jgi:hypothetical protein
VADRRVSQYGNGQGRVGHAAAVAVTAPCTSDGLIVKTLQSTTVISE